MASDTITVLVHGVMLEVDFDYSPAHRGYRNSFGAPEEPDEPEEVEIEEIRHEGCEIMCFFSDEEIAKVREAVLEERSDYNER